MTMKKSRFLVNTLFFVCLFTSIANISIATDYVTVANGNASDGAT